MGLHYAPESTGNAPYTTGLAEGLSSRGHTVQVLTGYPHYPEWKVHAGYKGWSSREVVNGVRVKRFRHHVPTRPTSLSRLHMELSFGVRLLFARWGRPDVIILVSPALFSVGVASLRYKLSRNRPAIAIWVQDLYSRGVVEAGNGSRGFGKLAIWLEARILTSGDGVVAIHERFARYIIASLHGSHSSTRVVRNWTHLPEAPCSDRRDTRASLGWSEDEIIVLHAGNMGKKQGLHNVVTAAKYAETIKSKVRFVLMGDGNQKMRLIAASAGISNIDFVDSLPQRDFQAAMRAADVLLVNELPGVKDMSVPSKLTSYFSAGVPVLAATDEGSVTASEIEASSAGVRVNANDPQGLVQAAEELAQDPELAARLGDNGIRFTRDTLSAGAAIDQFDDYVRHLAQSRSR